MGGAARESETSLDRRGRERLLSALQQFVEKQNMGESWNEKRGEKNPPFFFFLNPDNQATRTYDAAMKEDEIQELGERK